MDNAVQIAQLKQQLELLEKANKTNTTTQDPPSEHLVVKEAATGYLYLGEYHTFLGKGTDAERQAAFSKIDAVRAEIRKRNGQK